MFVLAAVPLFFLPSLSLSLAPSLSLLPTLEKSRRTSQDCIGFGIMWPKISSGLSVGPFPPPLRTHYAPSSYVSRRRVCAGIDFRPYVKKYEGLFSRAERGLRRAQSANSSNSVHSLVVFVVIRQRHSRTRLRSNILKWNWLDFLMLDWSNVSGNSAASQIVEASANSWKQNLRHSAFMREFYFVRNDASWKSLYV